MKLRIILLSVLTVLLALGCKGEGDLSTLDTHDPASEIFDDTKTDDGTGGDVLNDAKQDREQTDEDTTIPDDDADVADEDTTVPKDEAETKDQDTEITDDDGMVEGDDGAEPSQCVVDADCKGQPLVCHQFKCADGECIEVPVDNDTSCSDGNMCTAPDTCQDGDCVSGPEIVCDDKDPCTEDSCDPASGCVYDPVDASTTITCGVGECFREVQKCTDGKLNECTPGEKSQEVCDGLDNDCDGATDEPDANGCLDFLIDSDGDGYGNEYSRFVCVCPLEDGGVPLGYADQPGDCCDNDANVNQDVTEWFETKSNCNNFDYNCDFEAEKRYQTVGKCELVTSGQEAGCSFKAGWDSFVPECGESNTYIKRCDLVGRRTCKSTTETRVQPCR